MFLVSKIIKDAILSLDSEDRTNVLIIDDSMFERNHSKKVELLAKVYDHVKHKFRFGFRMLTLGWSDGSTFLPVSNILLSTENKKNRINEAAEVDKRTVGYKRRQLSMEKGTLKVFFKVCQSYLNLSKECNSLSYEAMTAHTFYTFLIKCLISHGYRLFKYCSNVQNHAYKKYRIIR